MIGRLRLRLGDLLTRLRRPRRRSGPPPPPGQARNVIVVRPRDPRFREVIYVLRDEALPGEGEEREELLRQALEAARREHRHGTTTIVLVAIAVVTSVRTI